MYYLKTILKLEILQILYIRVVKKSIVIMCGKLTLEGVGFGDYYVSGNTIKTVKI